MRSARPVYSDVICAMTEQDPVYLDNLFVADVNELERLGKINPRSDYEHLQMSAILRRLTLDEQPIVHHAAKRCQTPLIILVPEPKSGNPRYDPEWTIPAPLVKYAPEISERTHPTGTRGYFWCPYELDGYLRRTHMVLPANDRSGALRGRPISPSEMILFLANKLGGVHADRKLRDLADGGRSVDAATLHQINQHVSIFGKASIFQQFGIVAERVWRCCAPLRDELAHRE